MIKILIVSDYETASADSAIRLKKEVVSDADPYREIFLYTTNGVDEINIPVKKRCKRRGFKSYFGKAWEDQ